MSGSASRLFPPWNKIGAAGKLAGFDIDTHRDLCKRAAVTCELIPGEWTSLNRPASKRRQFRPPC